MVEKRRVAVLFEAEGGEEKYGGNMNDLLKPYGMSCSNDSVLRTVYYKYLHPKEVFVSHGVLQPSLVANKHLVISGKRKTKREQLKGDALKEATANGGWSHSCILEGLLCIRRPARAVLSTGAISYPIHRTVCAAWEGKTDKDLPPKSRSLASSVWAPAEMFADDWLDKEENNIVMDLLFKWLCRDDEAPSLVAAAPSHQQDGQGPGLDAPLLRSRRRCYFRAGGRRAPPRRGGQGVC